MPRRKRQNAKVVDLSYGFGAWENVPYVVDYSHTHTDIELNFFSTGSVRYFLAGRFETLPPGRLAMFWAGFPHHLVHVPPQTSRAWVVHVPLAWFMQWRLNESFTQHLLDGQVVMEPAQNAFETTLEKCQFQRWADGFAEGNPEATKIVMLEVEARVRRMAKAGVGAHQSHPGVITEGGAAQIEKVSRFIAEHYTEPLSVTKIASAMQLHPKYLMQLFKKHCGLSMWEYLLRMRSSHAQQLLINTDLKILDVALESGFGSMCRFHALFERYCGCTPRQYRMKMQGEEV
ncbi:MAG: helix-turn-helix domain-containing protein [Chthoniobacteraceae bacterium]